MLRAGHNMRSASGLECPLSSAERKDFSEFSARAALQCGILNEALRETL
jgi:hypothetical protein